MTARHRPRTISILLSGALLLAAACAGSRDGPTSPGGFPQALGLYPPETAGERAPGVKDRGFQIDSLPGGNVRTHPATPLGFEQEAAVTAHPTDASKLVAVWQDVGTQNCWTSDGGQSWQCQPLAPAGSGAGSDPAIGVNGRGDFFAP